MIFYTSQHLDACIPDGIDEHFARQHSCDLLSGMIIKVDDRIGSIERGSGLNLMIRWTNGDKTRLTGDIMRRSTLWMEDEVFRGRIHQFQKLMKQAAGPQER